jgi:hypothetical protein
MEKINMGNLTESKKEKKGGRRKPSGFAWTYQSGQFVISDIALVTSHDDTVCHIFLCKI